MNRRKARVIERGLISLSLLVSGLLLLPVCCVGQSASAPIEFNFTGSSAPVYDLTGSYRFEHQVMTAGGVPVQLALTLALQQDSAGRLQGSGTNIVQIGKESHPASYVVTGRISGGGRMTRATLVARIQGEDFGENGERSFVTSIQYNLEVRPAGLKGTARGTARFAELGKGSIRSVIAGIPLPAGMDGSWSVKMNILPLSRLYGTASIQLPNGRSVNTSLAGTASAASGLNAVKLAGTDSDRGNSLNINFYSQTRGVQKLSGRILGQTVGGTAVAAAQFAGSQACIECHGPIEQTVTNAFHARIGVQCEGCHGPAAQHAANYYDPLTRPIVDFTGTQCGTCHSGALHPTYEEWSSSEHATLVADMNATNRINNCAQCHSGSVRVSWLDGVSLPPAGANVPIGCPTCHSPHASTPYPALLRNPMASTNDYAFIPSTNFFSTYNVNINLCGQCHNHMGTSWTNNSAAPHYSPQYNILLGTIGEFDSGSAAWSPGSHAGLPESAAYSFSGMFYLTNQCVSCHMQDNSAPAHTASHTFKADIFDACYNCHTDPELMIEFLAVPAISNRVWRLKYGLDQWAFTKAPPGLQTNGVLAWEYTRPGGLIWQTNNGVVGWTVVSQVNFTGPDAAGQLQIPEPIRKARFNMYLAVQDGSFGIHNPFFVVDLLETALTWVSNELNQ